MTQAATLAQLASSGALTADTSGNVGIGTSSPGTKVDANGIVRAYGAFSLSGAGVTGSSSTFSAGTISSDINWGMYFRGNTGGSSAEFAWVNGAGSERMRIDSNGSVGIGLTPNSSYRLHVRGGGATSSTVSFLAENSSGVTQLFLRNDNFFNSAAIANYSVAGTGLVIDANNFVGKTTSSLRYKKDIVDYDKGLTALKLLRPVYYKSAVEGPNGIDPKQHAGFVAEEIADAGFEEFLVRDLEGRPDAIQYAHITALLVASIKELKAELDVCKAEIAALKGV